MKPITNQAYKLLHEGSIALSQVEANGIRIDLEYLNRAIHKTGVRIDALSDKLRHHKVYKVWRREYGSKTNLQSREQLGKVLFDVMGFHCPSRTEKTKRPKADEAALKLTGLKFVDYYLKLEKLKNARSTYLGGILREVVDGFVHPNFPLNLVRSYRGSSDHPNFQNIPLKEPEIAKLIRRAFIARRNHQIIEIDFKGAEICCGACYHKDPQIIKYIENPKLDMHRDMGAECYMVKRSQVSWGIRDCGKNRFVFPEFYGDWYKSRAVSLWKGIKEMNLVIEETGVDLYSHLKSKGICELGACDIDEEPKEGTFEKHIQEVEYDFWNRRFKVYAEWKKQWYNKYLKKGYFEMLTGFIVEGLYNRKQVINYPIQGTAFHWLLWSLIRVQKLMNKYKMKSLVVGQIHDSMIIDVYRKERRDFLEIVRQVIYEDIRKHWKWIIVPLTVEVSVAPVGGNWYEKEKMGI